MVVVEGVVVVRHAAAVAAATGHAGSTASAQICAVHVAAGIDVAAAAATNSRATAVAAHLTLVVVVVVVLVVGVHVVNAGVRLGLVMRGGRESGHVGVDVLAALGAGGLVARQVAVELVVLERVDAQEGRDAKENAVFVRIGCSKSRQGGQYNTYVLKTPRATMALLALQPSPHLPAELKEAWAAKADNQIIV